MAVSHYLGLLPALRSAGRGARLTEGPLMSDMLIGLGVVIAARTVSDVTSPRRTGLGR